MDYQSCCDWMFNRFPTFQKYGTSAFKPGLHKIEELSKSLINKLESKTIIHLAGTNGKGSTSSMIASSLKVSGYKVGLFTSPHFLSFVERIQVNGDYIPEQTVELLINENKERIEGIDASFFEISLWLALEYFCQENVDCIVLETGLGGRLDATNFLKQTDLSIITNISLDHINLLGDTIGEIAIEKGGIIKENSLCLIGEKQSETTPIFEKLCLDLNTQLFYANQFNDNSAIFPELIGDFQRLNSKTAYAACQLLKPKLSQLTEECVVEGINKSQSHFFLPGRWHCIDTEPRSIYDMGHNIAGVNEIILQLEKETYNDLHIVWSMVSDKDVDRLFSLLPKHAIYYFSEMDNPRSLTLEELSLLGKKHKLNFKLFDRVNLAVNDSFIEAKSFDLVFCGGSAFLIAEIFETFFCKSLAELKKHSIFATVNNKKGN